MSSYLQHLEYFTIKKHKCNLKEKMLFSEYIILAAQNHDILVKTKEHKRYVLA